MDQIIKKMSVRYSTGIAIPVIFIEFYILSRILFGMDFFFGYGVYCFTTYLIINLFFHSSLWNNIAGQGKLNIIPTVFIVITTGIIGVPLLLMASIPIIIGLVIEPVAYITAYLFFPTVAFLLGAIFKIDWRMPKGTFIVINNHSSFIDTMILIYIMGIKKWSVVVKEKIKYYPPLCFFVWGKVVYVPKIKDNLKRADVIINGMCKKVKKDCNFVVFPEGTRFSDGKIHNFKNGAFEVSVKTKTPVLIVALKSPWVYCPKNRLWIVPSVINIQNIDIVEPKDLNPEELKKICHQKMSLLF